MNHDSAMSRREFLKLSLAATVTVFVQAQLPGTQTLQQFQESLLPTRLAGILAHQESAQVIGTAYLQQYPQEGNARILLDRIVSSPTAGDIELFNGTDQGLRQLLDRMIREDFGADRVVKLQGWILATTEARLCALATLV
jgi:hypothetical protein